MIEELNATELEVACMAGSGDWANFDASSAVVRAEILRRLVLGKDLPLGDQHPAVSVAAIRVRGARILGMLDLSDAAYHGESRCPPITLEDCAFVPDEKQEARCSGLTCADTSIG